MFSYTNTLQRNAPKRTVQVALASIAALGTLGGCNSSEERALALASISQCNNDQPTINSLMLNAQRPAYRDRVNAAVALAVAENCHAGLKRLEKKFPDHPCIPFLESSVEMAEIAHESFSGRRPMTTADLSASRLAQNRSACLASGAPGVYQDAPLPQAQ